MFNMITSMITFISDELNHITDVTPCYDIHAEPEYYSITKSETIEHNDTIYFGLKTEHGIDFRLSNFNQYLKDHLNEHITIIVRVDGGTSKFQAHILPRSTPTDGFTIELFDQIITSSSNNIQHCLAIVAIEIVDHMNMQYSEVFNVL